MPSAPVLVSACLLGAEVRHHGGSARSDSALLRRWVEQGRVVSVCPEVAGGLGTPRPAAELVGGDGAGALLGIAAVLTKEGRDVTPAFVAGAAHAVALAKESGARVAVLKSHSPSCGTGLIYDGTFSGQLQAGIGVTAAALQAVGVRVFSEAEIEEANAALESIDRGPGNALEQPASIGRVSSAPAVAAFRRAVESDADSLALVGAATFLETFAGILPGPDIVAHCSQQHTRDVYLGWLRDPAARLWIAEAVPGSAAVGYLVMDRPSLPLADLRETDVEIKRIYVMRRFQRAGIGLGLMRRAIDEASRIGAERVLLGVYDGNERAIAFYQSVGFVRIGERRFRVGANEYHDYVLSLGLPYTHRTARRSREEGS